MHRISARRGWVVVRLVLGCSLVLGLMGYPSASVGVMTSAVTAANTAPSVATPPTPPSYNDALPSAAPEPVINPIGPTAKEVGPEAIMPMPARAGNSPEWDVPIPDPWDDVPINTNQDAYEQVVARTIFSGTSAFDSQLYTLNGEQLEAIILLQALTTTEEITISVLLPAGLDYVGKGSDDGEVLAGGREIRWTNRIGIVGINGFRSYTVTVNQPSLPAQLFVTTRISGPGLASDVLRVTPVWVGAAVSQVASSGAETTMQASDRIQLRFPAGSLNADTQITSIHHVPTVQDDGVAGQLQLPFSLKPDVQQFNTPVAITISLQGLYTAGMKNRAERPALYYAQPISTENVITGFEFLGSLAVPGARLVEVPSSFDANTGLLTAELNHFSDYRVSIKQPEDPGVWKLKANRGDVGLFRGEVNYSYPLAVPRMADGLQPNLTLGYSSAAADLGAGDTLGLPEGTHSSFGKGWGLDMPRVTRHFVYLRAIYMLPFLLACRPAKAIAPVFDRGTVQIVIKTGVWQGCMFALVILKKPVFTLSFGGRTYNLKPANPTQPSGVYVTEEHTPLYVLRCGYPLPCYGDGSLGYDVPGVKAFTEFWQVWTPDGTRHIFGNDEQSRARNVWLLRKTLAANRDDIKTGRASVEYRYGTGQNVATNYSLSCYIVCGFDVFKKTWARLSEIRYGNSIHTDGSSAAPQYTVQFSYPDAASDRITNISVLQGATPLRNYVFDRPAPGYNLSAIREQHWDGSKWLALPGPSFGYTELDHATLMTSLSNGYGMGQSFEYRKTAFNNAHVVSAINTNTSTGWKSKTKYDYAQPCADKRGADCYNPASNIEGFFQGFNRWAYGPGSETLIGHAAVTETVQETNGTMLTQRAHQFHTDYKKLGREFETRTLNAAGEVLQAQHTHYRVVNGPVIDLLPIDTWHTSVAATTAYPGPIGTQPYRRTTSQYYFDLLPQTGYTRISKGVRFFSLHRGVRDTDMPSTYANGNSEWYLLSEVAPDTRPLYFCGDRPEGTYRTLSLDAGCESDALHQRAGYIYTTRKVDTSPLYRCPDGFEMDFVPNPCAGGTLLGYAVDATAIYHPSNPVFAQVAKSFAYDTGMLKTVTSISYTVGSLHSYFMRPISQTLHDANGNVLNRAWIDYDGRQGYSYAPGSTDNLAFFSGPVFLRDFGLRWVIPFLGDLTYGQTTRVQVGDDRDATTEQYQYDAIGNVSAVTDTRGFVTTAQYDLTGDYLLTTTNALSHTAHYEYFGANGQPLQNNWGSTLGLLKRKVPPNGEDAAVSYGYDVYGRLTQVTQPGDSTSAPTLRYAYSDAANFAPPLKIEAQQRETAACAECVHKSFEFYDGLGQLLQKRIETIKNVQQRVMSYAYDALGRAVYESVPISVTDPTPNGAVFNNYATPDWNTLLKTQTEYDAAGRPVRVKHVDGTVTESSFISSSTIVTDANGHRKEQVADGFGRLQRAIEYAEAETYITQYAYDAKDNLTSVTDAVGNVTRMAYDTFNRKTSMSDPDMGDWRYAYDRAGNLVWQSDAKGQAQRFVYDPLGRLSLKHSLPASWHDPFETLTTTWSVKGSVQAQGGVMRIGASASAINTRPIAPGGGARFKFRDTSANGKPMADFKLQTGQNATLRSWGFTWLLGNAQVHVEQGTRDAYTPTLALRNNTWYEAVLLADVSGEFVMTLWEAEQPNNRVEYKLRLNPAGFGGRTWNFSVAVTLGSIEISEYSEVYVADAVQTFYDESRPGEYNIGQRTHISNTNDATAWGYDARGRVVSQTKQIVGIGPLSTRQTYDSANRITASTLPNGEGVNASYTDAGEPRSLKSDATGWIVTDANYNQLGGLSQLKLGNGLGVQQKYWGVDGNPTAQANKSFGRLRQLCVITSTLLCNESDGSTALLNLIYSYDNIGNITEINDRAFGNQSLKFGYDALDRLTSARAEGGTQGSYTEGYRYDAIGNFISKAGQTQWYSDTQKHAVTHVNGERVALYDANGNMSLRTDISGTQRLRFAQAWDVNNRLIAVTNTATSDTTRFFYDGDGGRVRRIAPDGTTYYFGGNFELFVPNGRPFGNATHNVFLPQVRKTGALTATLGLAFCAVVARAGTCTITTHYGFGGQRVALHEQTPTSDAVYWLHGDHLGSASLVTDKDGKKISELRYKPYGETRFAFGNPHTERRYTSQRSEEKWLGALYDYGARFYWVGVGRFLSPDSANDGLNRYMYVHGNPIQYSDPTGHFAWILAGAAVGALVAYGAQVKNNYDRGLSGLDAFTSNISWQKIGTGALIGAVAVALAPLVLAAAGDVLTGIGLATGSTALFSAGMSTYGMAGALGAAIYGGASLARGFGDAASSSSSGEWTRDIDSSIVARGHGARTNNRMITIPENSSVSFWVQDGELLDDQVGRTIERGQGIAPVEVLTAGEKVHNYKLFWGSGLTYAEDATGTIIEVSTPGKSMTLAQLFRKYPNGTNICWAACRQIASTKLIDTVMKNQINDLYDAPKYANHPY